MIANQSGPMYLKQLDILVPNSESLIVLKDKKKLIKIFSRENNFER
jgi:hypothetical protein